MEVLLNGQWGHICRGWCLNGDSVQLILQAHQHRRQSACFLQVNPKLTLHCRQIVCWRWCWAEQLLAGSAMEGHLCANLKTSVEKPLATSPPSCIALLKVYRELLVSKIRHTQCLIDNLINNEYFSTEDAEIVVQFPTQADKVLFLFH